MQWGLCLPHPRFRKGPVWGGHTTPTPTPCVLGAAAPLPVSWFNPGPPDPHVQGAGPFLLFPADVQTPAVAVNHRGRLAWQNPGHRVKLEFQINSESFFGVGMSQVNIPHILLHGTFVGERVIYCLVEIQM